MGKLKDTFSVTVIEHETEDYGYRIQNCIQILLDKVIKKDLGKN